MSRRDRSDDFDFDLDFDTDFIYEGDDPARGRHEATADSEPAVRGRHEAPESPQASRARPEYGYDSEDGGPRMKRVELEDDLKAAPRSQRARYDYDYDDDRPSRARRAEYDDYDDRYSRGRARKDESDYEEYRRWQETGGRSRSRGIGAPLIILIVLLAGGMIFAGWKLGSIFLNYRRDRSAYNDLAMAAISGLTEQEKEKTDADPQEETGADRKNYGVPIDVDWAFLRQQNSDVIGWLYCPNTIINYPVVQSEDHDFYLDHGFDKQPNTSGTLFADRYSSAGVVMSNFIIYGHNMKDHSMFGTLTNYTNESYYKDNPTLYYLTPNGNYRVELICAHIVESTVDNFPTLFSSTAEYQSYLNRITSSAFWVNSQAVNTNYQMITLSTCSYTSGYVDPRFLVHGILIPIE